MSKSLNQAKSMIRWTCDEYHVIKISSFLPLDMRRNNNEWILSNFELEKAIYKGKASLIYMAKDLISKRNVVLKLYRKSKLSCLNKYQVEREIRLHSELRHDNIIEFFAAVEDVKFIYIIEEYAQNGDLFNFLKKNNGRLTERQIVKDIMYPFLNVLEYLHAKGIIHRDIKPENTLISKNLMIKVADFGLSINMNEERPVTRAGTLDYMAPEVLICPSKSSPNENKDNNSLAYNQKVDIWALGVLAFELASGAPPFEKASRSDTYNCIMYQEPVFPSYFSSLLQDFIRKTLVKNSAGRMSLMDLMRHPWIALHKSLASKSHEKRNLDYSTLNISKHNVIRTSETDSLTNASNVSNVSNVSNEIISSPVSVLEKMSEMSIVPEINLPFKNIGELDNKIYLKSALKSDSNDKSTYEKEVKFNETTAIKTEEKQDISIKALHDYFSRKSDYNKNTNIKNEEMEEDVINRIPSYAFFPQREDLGKQGNRELTGTTRMSFAEKCMNN